MVDPTSKTLYAMVAESAGYLDFIFSNTTTEAYVAKMKISDASMSWVIKFAYTFSNFKMILSPDETKIAFIQDLGDTVTVLNSATGGVLVNVELSGFGATTDLVFSPDST